MRRVKTQAEFTLISSLVLNALFERSEQGEERDSIVADEHRMI
jgi:hypothetical protein